MSIYRVKIKKNTIKSRNWHKNTRNSAKQQKVSRETKNEERKKYKKSKMFHVEQL